MQAEDEEESEFNFDQSAVPDKSKNGKARDEPRIIKSKLNKEVDEEFGDNVNLLDIDTKVSNEEFVKLSIERAKKLFKREAGRADTKRANLGDIKSTRVNIPPILQ